MDEDQARAEAEARRQRILDAANSRMDRVSGLAGSDGKEAAEITTEDGAAAEKKPSSKLAAMRKRRFQKKKAAPAETTAPVSGTDEQEQEKDNSKTEKETTTTESLPKEQEKEKTPDVPATKEDTVSEPATAAAESSEAASSSKKYMGVAKMRRKMIKEKQKQQEQGSASEQVPSALPQKFSKLAAPKPTFPIMMHLLTVLFLFLAGFEVGLQQSVIEYRGDNLTIHQTVAPQQELRLLNQGVSLSYFSPSPTILKEAGETNPPPTPYVAADQEDEFATNDDKDDAVKEENLDPLFGVDLDALTSGPGLFMFLGRFAVSVHRMILSIFYYFPIRIWNNVLFLIASPPVLCLAALAIRQGSHVLGGKLPEASPDEAKTSTQPQDIMATIKNGVTSLIGRAFPTLTKIYEAWTHLRSDMYVVMCGLFVGLVYHHYLAAPVTSTTSASDEL